MIANLFGAVAGLQQAVSLLLLIGLYFLLAGQVSGSEAAAGAGAVVVTALFAVRWSQTTRQKFWLAAPWGKILAKTAWALPRDSFKVGLILIRAILKRPSGEVGSIVRYPMRAGDGSPGDAGRRAILVLANSLPPNGFVLEVSQAAGMTLHRLAPAAIPTDQEWPL